MVLAALSALLLGTTPEATIKEFIAAVNAQDFNAARKHLVAPGKPDRDAFLKEMGLKIELQQFRVKYSSGTKAVVVCRAVGTTSRDGGKEPFKGDNEEVQLTKVGSDWKIQFVNQGMGGTERQILNIMAYLLSPRGSEAFAGAREAAQKTSALSKAKQLATGFMIYCTDYDDVLPKYDNWKKSLFPYVKNEELFTVPPDKKGALSWTYNKNIAGKPTTIIEFPAQTVLIFLSKNGKPDYRFGGKTIVAFSDGSAKVLSKEQFAKVKWK
ncbi:MAG: hypothetical protein JST35_07250 [Armatimonadetes bacterium]|nr:hypothetical protein [Armatimonadota bacterium]